MKFDTYEEYIEKAKEHYSKKDIKIPVEYMFLSEEMFNLFNGSIQFGVSSCEQKCQDCTCEKSEKET